MRRDGLSPELGLYKARAPRAREIFRGDANLKMMIPNIAYFEDDLSGKASL
jgi:hypothetical protein